MKMTVLTARQSAGHHPAREALLDKLTADYKNRPFAERARIIVLVPQQETHTFERELIERIGQGGLFGIQILSFERLRRKILNETGAGKLAVVDEHGRLMLIQKALANTAESLGVFRASVKKQGFVQETAAQISEFKQAGITPDMLELEARLEENTLLNEKVKDLRTVYTEFGTLLGEDRLDEDDLRTISSEKAIHADFLKGADLYLLDYGYLEGSDVKFLMQLARAAASVTLSVTADLDVNARDASAFACAVDFVGHLKRESAEAGISFGVRPIQAPAPQDAHGALSFLEQNLFSYRPGVYKEPAPVRLVAASEPWDEAERTARMILNEVADGRPYSKIGVLTTSQETYGDKIARVFASYGIPVFVDEKHAAAKNHLISALLSALDAVQTGFGRDDMLAYAKSDFSGLTAEQADLLENYVIETGIRQNDWTQPFTRIPPARYQQIMPEGADLNVLEELRTTLMKPLTQLKKKLSGNKTYSVRCAAVADFLNDTKAEEKLEALSEAFLENDRAETASVTRQAWNILTEVLTQTDTVLGETKATLAEFNTVFKTGISSYTVGVIPENADAVTLTDLKRSRLPAMESLYVLGMNEGLLPAAVNETGLFSDSDREKLNEALGMAQEVLRKRSARHAAEELSFYTSVTKPSQRLTFLHSASGTDGSQLMPSRYIETLKQSFVYPQADDSGVLASLRPETAFSILTSLDRSDPEQAILARTITSWYDQKAQTNAALSMFRLGRSFAGAQDRLHEHHAADLYKLKGQEQLHVSVSRLEKFTDCPFSHFVQYGLRPVSREEYEVRALDAGNFTHSFMESFFKAIKEEAENGQEQALLLKEYLTNPQKLNEKASQLFESLFTEESGDAARYAQNASARYLKTRLYRLMLEALTMLLEQLSGAEFLPYAFEARVDDAFEEEALQNVRFTGRIDRIDTGAAKDGVVPVRIIDYKTGRKTIDFASLYDGKALQLLMYLREAVQVVAKETDTPAKPTGAFYFPADSAYVDGVFEEEAIKHKEAARFGLNGIYDSESEDAQNKAGNASSSKLKLSANEMALVTEFVAKKAAELAGRMIVEGDTRILPSAVNGKPTGCAYCEYRDICRFNGLTGNTNVRETKTFPGNKKDDFFAEIQKGEKNE